MKRKKKELRDTFEISDGNLEVFLNVPKMMKIRKNCKKQ